MCFLFPSIYVGLLFLEFKKLLAINGRKEKRMAKLEQKLIGDFDNIVDLIENGIISGSASATLEGRSDFIEGDCRCTVRVFERYSYLGGNRLSLNVTLFQKADGLLIYT